MIATFTVSRVCFNCAVVIALCCKPPGCSFGQTSRLQFWSSTCVCGMVLWKVTPWSYVLAVTSTEAKQTTKFSVSRDESITMNTSYHCLLSWEMYYLMSTEHWLCTIPWGIIFKLWHCRMLIYRQLAYAACALKGTVHPQIILLKYILFITVNKKIAVIITNYTVCTWYQR